MKKSSKVKAKAVRKSPTKKSDSSKDSLAFELNSIRQSLESLRSALGINPTQQPHIGTGQPSLGVFITRSNTATKPFLAQFQGALNSSVKLSNIRAAILITLIVDLQDRVEGGRGIEDPLATIATIATSLGTIGADDSEGDIESAERVRVAVYRFWDFCQSTDYLRSSVLELDFDDKLIRFIARKPGSGQALENLKIDVTSDDQALSSIISSALTRSPIEELKRRKALFVPAGADAADRLLLEMYDHSYPLTVTSLYVRPPLPSYPDQLLQKIGVSERVKRRKQLAFEGYRSGRIQFFEVLNESTIWDLIRESEHGGFTMYPDSVTKEDIAAHIANLIEILRRFDNYHFYITKVVVPFVVVTYDIQSGTPAESFTVFFQASQSAAQRDLGCFALYDRAVFQSLSEHIVRWILTHPSTIRDRGEVISLLERVLSHLSNKGSLKPGERHPE